jgi:pimeloyl-ACP methyl ester carboxylesterase
VPRLRTLLLTLSVIVLCGCVSTLLAHKVVAPPNKSGIEPLFSDWEILKHGPEAYRAQWVVDIKTPPAKIAVASIEPGDYGFIYEVTLEYPEGRAPNITRFNSSWRPAAQVPLATGPPRGTVLLLHGFLQRKEYLAPWAVRLAQAGYRCVLLDLRGHGASTGAHISFGAFESRDVSAVLDDLGARGWDVSHVGVLGVSYGASVALLAAGRDPRITAVVAFEPFASAGRAVPELMRAAFASEAAGISDQQFAAAHIKEARIAGFSWAEADIAAALQRTRAPVLFIHGAADTWVSPDHSRTLMKVAPPGSELKIIPKDNHVSLPLQIEPFQQAVIDWFDAGKPRP